MKWIPTLGLVVAFLSACSSTVTVEDRPGATNAQSDADHQTCHELVKRQPELYVPPQTGFAGAAGAGAIAGVASVVQEERAVGVCMARLGYSKRTLTVEETKAIRAAPRGAHREAILDAIMRAND
jgi:hypothetical protein